MTGKVREIGVYSKPHRLAKLDGRTREAMLMRIVREDLICHVGSPSAVQLRLIDRVAMLSLHVAMLDAKALDAGGLSERDSRQYLAYSNALGRGLRDLGLKAGAERPMDAIEFARLKYGTKAGEAA